ncbi:hypothetical protein CRPA5_02530 [Pseudomonas aeruginosa]
MPQRVRPTAKALRILPPRDSRGASAASSRELEEWIIDGAILSAAGAWAPGLDLSFWVARGRARGRAGVSGPGADGPDERPADGMEGGRRGRRWT